MRKNPASEVYDIPQYTYFEFGNTFTGSYGKLSYKIIPGENFTVQIWHSRLCSELADIEEEQTYPMTEDGFHEMLRWHLPENNNKNRPEESRFLQDDFTFMMTRNLQADDVQSRQAGFMQRFLSVHTTH